MNAPRPRQAKKLEFELTVSTEAQGRELATAWREIVEAAIRENPTSGQELTAWRRGGIELALNVGERQEAARAQLAEQKDLTARELLDREVNALADKYPQKSGA